MSMASAGGKASVDWKKIKAEILSCSVCKDNFDRKEKKPKNLSHCQHAFCQFCIGRLIQQKQREDESSFPCPECRKITPIPENGVEGFRACIHIERLLNYDPTNVSTSTSSTCQCCSENAPAEGYCHTECGYICGECHKLHQRQIKWVKGHQFENLSEDLEQQLNHQKSRRTCSEHKQDFTKFCNTCQSLVCCLCISSSHKLHEVCDLATAATEFQAKLDRLSDEALLQQDPIITLIRDIDREERGWKKQVDTAKSEVQKLRSKLQTELDNYFQVMTDGICAVSKQEYEKIWEKKEKAQLSLMKMGTSTDYASNAIKTGDFLAIIQAEKEIGPILTDIADTNYSLKSHQPVHTVLKFNSKLSTGNLLSDTFSCVGQTVDVVVEDPAPQNAFVGTDVVVSFKLSRLSSKFSLLDAKNMNIKVHDPKHKICTKEEFHTDRREVGLSVTIDVKINPVQKGKYKIQLIHELPVDLEDLVAYVFQGNQSVPQSPSLTIYTYDLEVMKLEVSTTQAVLNNFDGRVSVTGSNKNVGLIKANLRPLESNQIETVCTVEFDKDMQNYHIKGSPRSPGEYTLVVNTGNVKVEENVWITDGKISVKTNLCILKHPCSIVVRGIESLKGVQIELVDPSNKRVHWKETKSYPQTLQHWLTFTPSVPGDYKLRVKDRKSKTMQCHMIIPSCFLSVQVRKQSVVVGSICKATITVKHKNGTLVDLSLPSSQGLRGQVWANDEGQKNVNRNLIIAKIKASIHDDGKTLVWQFVPQLPCKHVISISTDPWEEFQNLDKEIMVLEYEEFGPSFTNPEGFKRPSDISFCKRSNTVLVADTEVNGLIKRLDMSGNIVSQYKAPITCVSVCALDSNGNLVLLYPKTMQLFVLEFSSTHADIKVIPYQLPETIRNPTAIYVNAKDHLLVADSSGVTSLKYSSSDRIWTATHKRKFMRSVDDDKSWYVTQICENVELQKEFVSSGHLGIVFQYIPQQNSTKTTYKIRNGKTGGLAITNDFKYLLISTQNGKEDIVVIFKIKHGQEKGGRIQTIPVESVCRESPPYLDKLIMLNDGHFLKLDGEAHRIRKYGYIREGQGESIEW